MNKKRSLVCEFEGFVNKKKPKHCRTNLKSFIFKMLRSPAPHKLSDFWDFTLSTQAKKVDLEAGQVDIINDDVSTELALSIGNVKCKPRELSQDHQTLVFNEDNGEDTRTGLCTTLTLHVGDSRKINKATESESESESDDENDQKLTVNFPVRTYQDDVEDMRAGLCTKLTRPVEDVWKIKKVLTATDVNPHHGRLLLTSDSAKRHIQPIMVPSVYNRIYTDDGVDVVVYDLDTETDHTLNMKLWHTSGGLVLVNKWNVSFLQRRALKRGDQIGLFWFPQQSKFYFRVLNRAPVQ